MREIYTAPTVEAAEARFAEFAGEWRQLYPAMIQAWQSVWEEFVPFLEFPAELRKIVYTTNAIESLNARFRRAVRHRGHFPTEQAALKVLYLVATQKRKNRSDMTGKINGWKTILNTLTVHYGDRIAARPSTEINDSHSYLHKESDSPERGLIEKDRNSIARRPRKVRPRVITRAAITHRQRHIKRQRPEIRGARSPRQPQGNDRSNSHSAHQASHQTAAAARN